MKHLTVAAALALALATAGCSGDTEEPDTAAPAPAESSAGAEPTEAAEPAESAAAGGGENVLTGTVGEEDDPDAFVLTLTDSAGEPVTELPAGEYTINVNDRSEIHNFHLTGGEVDESTTVPETGEKSFTVELTAGDYEAVCDPHPNMIAEFTVT